MSIENPQQSQNSIPGKKKGWLFLGIFIGIILVIAVFFLLFKMQHQHSWISATCTEVYICEECGETKGTALGHLWTEATCTAPKTCQRCKVTRGTTQGHLWTEATCTAPKTCQQCGETQDTALGHRWIDATYEAPKTCSTCGVTEGNVLVKTWVYINELDYIAHDGKVWTMSREQPNFNADQDITDAKAHANESKPGHVTGPVFDHLGKAYTYGLSVDGVNYKTYDVTYYLGGEYDTFSGHISMTPDVQYDEATKTGKYFEVYGDGSLLYVSPTMTMYCRSALTFSVDVSGVTLLTIRYPKTTGPSRMATIFDGKLSVD